MEPRFIGIEIGGTKLQVTAGEAGGHVLQRCRFKVEPQGGAEAIRNRIQTALPGLLEKFKPLAVGAGFGGPVDWRTGNIRCSHQVEGWSEFPLGEWLRQSCGLPARVDNDANVAALGEAMRGAGKGRNPVFYATLGSGVGGGLVVNGAIYHGAPPGEAELGHVRLDRSGVIIEQRCSGWAVDAKVRRAAGEDPESFLARSLPAGSNQGEARFLRAALDAHDPVAWGILRETCDELAFGLSHVMHLFHPEVIILGGGLSLVGETLRAETETAMARYRMKAFGSGTAVLLAQLGEDAVPAGALLLAASVQER